jgi:hypothetical protein
MPIHPIKCRCQLSADGHRSISVPIHCPDWVPIDLSVHQPKRSHHHVPSSALGVFQRVHRFASTSLCTKPLSEVRRWSMSIVVILDVRTSENQDLSQSNSWAVCQRVGVRLRVSKEEAQRDRSPGASLCLSRTFYHESYMDCVAPSYPFCI